MDVQKCPKGHRLKVVESRPMERDGYTSIRRRKTCPTCKTYVLRTFEIDEAMFEDLFQGD